MSIILLRFELFQIINLQWIPNVNLIVKRYWVAMNNELTTNWIFNKRTTLEAAYVMWSLWDRDKLITIT